MIYRVRIIDDDDLPQEVPWAFVRQPDSLVFMLKQSAAREAEVLASTLEDAWNAFRMIDHDELMSWPEPVAAC